MLNSPPITQTPPRSVSSFDVRRHFAPDRLPLLAPGTGGALSALLAVCDIHPRRYQKRLICQIVQALAEGHSNVLAESPVASGKSVMGLATASLLQRATGCSVVWIGPENKPTPNILSANRSLGFNVRMNHITYEELLSDQPSPRDFDLTILDDLDQSPSGKMKDVFRLLTNHWSIGWLSSGGRQHRLSRWFDRTISSNTTRQLIDGEYLSPVDHYISDQHCPRQIASWLTTAPNRFGKSVVYFDRTQDCDLLYLLLRQSGVRVEVVRRSDQAVSAWQHLAQSRIEVLIDCTEQMHSMDCPDLKTVFCKPAGRTNTARMVGRVFQRSSATPIKQIVQSSHAPYQAERIAWPRQRFRWHDGRWSREQTSSSPPQLPHETRLSLK